MKYVILILFCLALQQAAAQQPFMQDEQQLAPQMALARQQLSEQVTRQLATIDWSHAARTTSGATALFTVPVVVHVVHNYGAELMPDDSIFRFIDVINAYFLKTTPDTALIIDKYKPVAANTEIAFKLATVAPDGSPTKGIDHIFSYLTNNAPDQVKMRQWPQDRYLNIWIVKSINSYTPAYPYDPLHAAYYPYYDGIVFTSSPSSSYGGYWSSKFAKWLDLPNPCGIGCVDNDGIPDTPPCNATAYGCSTIYSSSCDTPNVQNVMMAQDQCAIMFTYGQGQYMQYILQIDIGKRDSLVSPHNFAQTGMNNPMPDLLPVADFSVKRWSFLCRFFCTDQDVAFRNCSWNDTITAASWSFSNAPTIGTSSSMGLVTNKFYQPGWVTVSLSVTGNNTGTSTLSDGNALYIADTVPASAVGYLQEFAGTTMDGWPAFNYYGNNFRWQTGITGCYDGSSIMYTSFDSRPFPDNMTGGPSGDFDDLYSPPFDLTAFGSACYLNFMTSGASIANKAKFMNDSLEVSCSTDRAVTWQKLKTLKGTELANKGTVPVFYIPASSADWIPQAVAVPAAARTPYTIFRFTYHPGADSTGKSTGNSFYLDHLTFNDYPAHIEAMPDNNRRLTVAPNPTSGSVIVSTPDFPFGSFHLSVTDITGKTVYTRTIESAGTILEITIPAAVLNAPGVYFARVITCKGSFTGKIIKQ